MTVTAQRMPTTISGPVRICIVERLGSMTRDVIAVQPCDARRLARELWALADEADIQSTGGVPPTEGAMP